MLTIEGASASPDAHEDLSRFSGQEFSEGLAEIPKAEISFDVDATEVVLSGLETNLRDAQIKPGEIFAANEGGGQGSGNGQSESDDKGKGNSGKNGDGKRGSRR